MDAVEGVGDRVDGDQDDVGAAVGALVLSNPQRPSGRLTNLSGAHHLIATPLRGRMGFERRGAGLAIVGLGLVVWRRRRGEGTHFPAVMEGALVHCWSRGVRGVRNSGDGSGLAALWAAKWTRAGMRNRWKSSILRWKKLAGKRRRYR